MVTKEGVLGTPSAPIHMITAEGGLKVQAWRTLRTLALGFLILSGIGALIEDRGIGKGMCQKSIRCLPFLFASITREVRRKVPCLNFRWIDYILVVRELLARFGLRFSSLRVLLFLLVKIGKSM